MLKPPDTLQSSLVSLKNLSGGLLPTSFVVGSTDKTETLILYSGDYVNWLYL